MTSMHSIACTLCVFSSADDNNYSQYQNRTYNSIYGYGAGNSPDSNATTPVYVSPIVDYVAGALVNISFIYMLIITIFLTVEFTRPKSLLKSSYYYLIYVGCLTYLVIIAMWNLSFLTFLIDDPRRRRTSIELSLSMIGRWYYSFEVGMWNLFLALNRATALIYPVKYEKFWKLKYLLGYMAFILLYPFIVDSYTFPNRCRWTPMDRGCRSFRLADQWFAGALTSAKAMMSLLITVLALWMARKRGSLASSKIEKRLTLQTFCASILLIVFSTCELLAVSFYDDDRAMNELFNSLADLFYSLYYYPVIIILFVAVPTFRVRFFDFYIPSCIRYKSYTQRSRIINTQSVTIFGGGTHSAGKTV